MQKTPPLSTAPLEFHLPDVERLKLADGTPVMVIHREDQDLATVSIYLRSGAAHDTDIGAMAFAAELLVHGTDRLTSEQFTETVESLGATIRCNGDRSTTLLSGLCMSDTLSKMIGLMGEALLTPSFDENEISLTRERWVSELLMDRSDPDWLAAQAASRVWYSGHPYEHPRRGSLSDMKEMSREKIINAHKTLLSSSRTIIVAGPINGSEVVDLLNSALSAMPEVVGRPNIARALLKQRAACIATNKDAVQTAFRIGLPCPKYDHPDYAATQLITAVLGGYTLARLFTILREEKGYTYGAYAVSGIREHASFTEIVTSVGNEFTADTIATIHSELNRMATTRIDDEELEHARQHVLGSFARSNETPQQTAALVWTTVLHGLPENYFPLLIERLQEFRPEDLTLAQERYYNPDKWSVGASGVPSLIQEAIGDMADSVEVWDVKGVVA